MKIGNRYFIDNPESGLYEVSKQEYERYTKLMQELYEYYKPKLTNIGIKGRIIVFGAGSDFDPTDYADIFYNPEFAIKNDEIRHELKTYFQPSEKQDDEK